MRYSFFLFLLVVLASPAFTQHWRGDLSNKNLKGNVKTVISRYIAFEADRNGRLASVETHRYNDKGQLIENSTDFSGLSAFMSLKRVLEYNPSGQLVKSQYFNTRDKDGSEKLAPNDPDYITYDAQGRDVAHVTINSKGDTTFRRLKKYSADGTVKQSTDVLDSHSENISKIDERGNTIESFPDDLKCTYVYDDHDRVIEQRWHDLVTGKVYQRQTSKYENNRLVEKITYKGDMPETIATITYANPDAAGNYTKETWYDHGKLNMVFEYAFTYY